MRRVLIVAYYFPPIGGIGSIRLARFAESLPELGWDTTVLAPRHTPHAQDPHLRFPEERVVRSPSIEFSYVGRALLRVGSRGGEATKPRGSSLHAALRSAGHRFVLYPDTQIGWYPGAVISGWRALRRQRFDAIYSSSNPFSAHLVARTLSRRSGLPWIAEFRDPWRDGLPPDHPYRERAAALEASVAADATRVVMPTPTWAEHYGGLWGRTVDVLPNGYDAPIRGGDPPARPTLTHLGSFYPGLQNLTALWAALKDIVLNSPTEAPRVRFVGELPGALRAETEAYGIGSLVEATGFLPHDVAMRTMASSSMLVASGFSADKPKTRGWVPAKLFDYLASDLPILYLADPDTDAARMLADQPGCYVVEPTDVSGVAAALRAGLNGGRHPRNLEELSRRARTEALAAILGQAAAD
jgi:glycosyltransferase involved in cell wall biosynthesis